MAAGDMAGKVLKMTAGIMSEIDPKSTLKFMGKENMENLAKHSGAFKAGKKATNFLAGGTRDTIKNLAKKDANGKAVMGFKDAVKNAHKVTTKITDPDVAKQLGKKVGDMHSVYSGKKIAGTVMGLSMAGRVVTGGGIYRDKNGNVNLPGVPFI